MRGVRAVHPCTLRAIGRAVGVLVLLLSSLLALDASPASTTGFLTISPRLAATLIITPLIFSVVSVASGLVAAALGTLVLLSEAGMLRAAAPFITIELLVLVLVVTSRGIAGEALIDARRFGRLRTYTVTAAITVAGLIMWARQQVEDPLLLYAAAAANSAYVWTCNRGTMASLALGALSGVPLIGTAVAVLCSGLPSRVFCGRGVCLGLLIALRRPSSRPRYFEASLNLQCAQGYWRLPWDGPVRLLVVGEGWLPVPAGSILVQLEPGETSLSEFESMLSEASSVVRSGGRASIRVGVSGERSLVEGMLAVLGSFAAETRTPIVIDSCGIRSPSTISYAVKALESSPAPVIVRLCTSPPPRLSAHFTGPGAARVACRIRDPEILEWASRSVLGVREPDDATIAAIAKLIGQGYCYSSNICGWPGVFSPMTCAAE